MRFSRPAGGCAFARRDGIATGRAGKVGAGRAATGDGAGRGGAFSAATQPDKMDNKDNKATPLTRRCVDNGDCMFIPVSMAS